MNAPVDYHTDLAEEQEVKLSDYIAIVKRRKKPFFLVMALVLTTAIGLAMSLPPIYRSSALVLVQSQSMTSDILDSAMNEQADQSVEYLIRSVVRDDTLLKVIHKFDLFPSGNGVIDEDGEIYEGGRIAQMEKSISVKAVNPEVLNTRNRNRQQTEMAFEISFEYPREPIVAQQVTEEIVSLFMNANLEKRKQLTEETTGFLSEEKDKIQAKVDEIESKLEIFKKENNGFLPDQIAVLVTQQERTDRELLMLDQQISAVRSTAFQLQGQLAGTEAYVYEDRTLIRNEEGERVLSATGRLQTLQQRYHSLVSKYSSSHPQVKKVRNEIISLGGNIDAIENSPLTSDELEIARTQLTEAQQKYSGSHPTIARLERKIARLETQSSTGKVKAIPKEFNSLKKVNPAFSSLKAGVSRSTAELDSLIERKRILQEKQDDYGARMEGGPAVEREFTRMTRDRDDLLTEIRAIKKKLSSAERAQSLESQQKGDRFDLLEPAELPHSAIKPNRPAIVLLGGLLSIGLGFAIVMLLESLDESITSRRSLIAITGAHPIGTIPRIMSTSEAESIQRQQVVRYAMIAAGIVAIAAIAAWVNFNIMPLSELFKAGQ